MQEVMSKSTTETLVQLRFKVETASAGRSAHIFRSVGKDSIQFLTIGSRYILHIRHIFQTSFYFE